MDSNTVPQKDGVSADKPTPCRCCGQPLTSFVQPPLRPESGRPSRVYVTCWNKNCPMEGYTVEGSTYAQKDLSAYLCTDDSEDDSEHCCETCGGDGKVEGFNRSGGWSIATYVDCRDCGGAGVVRK